MVRLETQHCQSQAQRKQSFTFQYGQIRNRLFHNRIAKSTIIYIPVWLDQKQIEYCTETLKRSYLHSSMVRLETEQSVHSCNCIFLIYIPVWLDQKQQLLIVFQGVYCYLHSSMVRLETIQKCWQKGFVHLFTFQYGQIRNKIERKKDEGGKTIYIPVWLDQKLFININT